MSSTSNQPQYAATRFENELLSTAVEWLIATVLSIATGLVVIWQNTRLTVLWDLSYTLNNAYRISLGDVPYRDFPFAHPPITFLIQAAIIKLSGRVYWHHVAYCAIAGAVATILTWRIMRRTLRGARYAKTIALLLTLPLVPLGINCVFPHPFYDPDCTLAILLSLFLLLQLDERPDSLALPLLTGVTLVVPLFVKQNTGLAMLLSSVALLAALIIWRKLRRERVRHYAITLTVALATLLIVILLIQRTAGFGNYWHWTIQFAAARRTPARQEMLEIYTQKSNLIWLGFILPAWPQPGLIVARIGCCYCSRPSCFQFRLFGPPSICCVILIFRNVPSD